MAESVHLDHKTLERLRGFLSDDKLVMLLNRYVDDSARLVQQLDQACQQQEQDTARRCAHSLKSTSANVGALLMSDLARALEDLARTGQLVELLARMPDLHNALEMAKAAIAALTNPPSQAAQNH